MDYYNIYADCLANMPNDITMMDLFLHAIMVKETEHGYYIQDINRLSSICQCTGRTIQTMIKRLMDIKLVTLIGYSPDKKPMYVITPVEEIYGGDHD